jgi:uncharacterized protein (DUF2147 family)
MIGLKAAKVAIAALLGFLALSGAGFAGDADGDWARDDGLIRTRIAPCGGGICATNFWAKKSAGR